MNDDSKLVVKFNKSAIWVWIVFFGLFRPVVIPSFLRVPFRITLLAIGLLYILLQTQSNIRGLINTSLIVSMTIILSCIINYSNGYLSRSNLFNGIQYALCIYELYTIMEVYINKGRSEVLKKALCTASGLCCFISILMLLLMGRKSDYFIGSKYMTSYMMMFYMGIKYYLNEERIRKEYLPRALYICVMVLFAIIIYYMNCMTSFVSVLVMIVLVLFANNGFKKNICRPITMVFLMFAAMLTVFFISRFLEIGVVRAFILNVLHKSLTLTDRLRYYQKAVDVLARTNIIYGYGYASDEMRQNIALGTNIQNGLFQYLLYYGVIGVAALVASFSFATYHGYKQYQKNWPIFVVIIGFIVAATVEVSYNYVFFMTLFSLRWFEYKKEQNE